MFGIRKLDLLLSVYIFCIAVSELMGAKTFPIAKLGTFQLNASVAIFVVPIIFTINDIITEVFGIQRARSLVRSGIFVVFLFLLTSLFFTHLPPSMRFKATESAYEKIFEVSARISAASLTAFAVAEFLDILIFFKIRKKMGKKKLWLRTNVSNFISEFADSAIFISLAFYALDRSFGDNFSFLTGLIIPYWLLKCVMSIIETPFVYLGANWLKSEKE